MGESDVTELTVELEAIETANELTASVKINLKLTISPTLAKVVEALSEYILTDEVFGGVRSISTWEASVVLIT